MIAVFPGSFDPLTLGHLNLIRRASKLCTHLYVAVLTNTSKTPLFSSEEKVALINDQIEDLPNVSVVAVPAKLTVQVVRSLGATCIIRGVRNETDFNYERDIAAINAHLSPTIETITLFARPKYAFISSSMIKEVARFGGSLTNLVPPQVAKALAAKFQQ